MESRVELQLKGLLFNKLLITANEIESKIILSKDDTSTVRLKEVQTVIKAGPFCTNEGGSGIKEGDKVVLDPYNLKAARYAFNKFTGEYVPNGSTISKEELDFYLLVNDRDVVMVL